MDARSGSERKTANHHAIGNSRQRRPGRLRTALHGGLDAGLTVNETKEILIHLYAYAGFPRSLNAINTLMAVMDERRAQHRGRGRQGSQSPAPTAWTRTNMGPGCGPSSSAGKRSAPQRLPTVRTGHRHLPERASFRGHLLPQCVGLPRSRELATISALASMTGTAAQLRSHLGVAMNTGLTEAQMRDFIAVLQARVGKVEAELAAEVLAEVTSNWPR